MSPDEEVRAKIEQIKQGGPERYRQRAQTEGRLLVRERLARLLDSGFGVDTVRGHFVSPTESEDVALTTKREFARRLFDRIVGMVAQTAAPQHPAHKH